MKPKQFIFHNAARDKVRRGMGTLAKVVKVTPATGTCGDLHQRGVIAPAKVTRLALQNAASIASPILTIDCMIAAAPQCTSVVNLPPADSGAPGF